MTLEELKARYKEKGATTQRTTQSGDAGDVIDYLTNDLGEGFAAREDQPIIGYEGQGMDATPIYGDKVLSGFTQAKDGMDYFYDPEGVFQGAQKSQEADTFWDTFGPLIMGAMTMDGGSAALGGYLFPSLGATAAAGAGGALAGGFNAAMTDQDILKGALKGGAGSAGALKLGDTGFTLGDATKAINFAQNPTLAGVANIASPYLPNVSLGEGAVSLNDVLKGVSTAQDLSSGDYKKIFKAITGMANDQGKSLKSSFGSDENFSADLIPGYFNKSGQEMTVTEDPENLDAFLESLSQYSAPSSGDGLDEVVITGDRPKQELNSLRTKEIKSDIPDEITPDQIDRLFPDIDFNDLLQTVIAEKPKAAAPTATAKQSTPSKTNTDQALANLGLNAEEASQDPYADIKLMEELFGGDTAYKLRSLGASKNLASADLNALAKLLRG